MLDQCHESSLSDWLAGCPCCVELPAAWQDFFDRTGVIPSFPGDDRRFPRFYIRGRAAISVVEALPARPRDSAWHGVFTKDISRGGIRFLHSEQLFPHERLEIVLPDGSKRQVEVARCGRVQRRCFDIEVRFAAGAKRN